MSAPRRHPRPACPDCNGSGEIWLGSQPYGSPGESYAPCHCVMVVESDEIRFRGARARLTIADSESLPDKYVTVSLYFRPRQDGENVPAFTADVRIPTAEEGAAVVREGTPPE